MGDFLEAKILMDALAGDEIAVQNSVRGMLNGERRELTSALFVILEAINEVRAERTRHPMESDEDFVLRVVGQHMNWVNPPNEDLRPTIDRLVAEGRIKQIADPDSDFEVLLLHPRERRA